MVNLDKRYDVVNPTHKECTKCHEVKLLDRFSVSAGRHRSTCKDCRRKPRKRESLPRATTRKRCWKCRQMVLLSEFPASRQTSDGLKTACRPCNASESRAWVIANPERVKEWRGDNRERLAAYSRAYQQLNPEKCRQKVARRRSRKLQAVISIFTEDQAIQRAAAWGNRCWMCGTSAWSHWDHVKPLSKGGAHCLANLRPACAPCNLSKGSKWLGVQWASKLRTCT